MRDLKILDCTLRDGGYYNNWDFDFELIKNYLSAMEATSVDFVELGLRSLKNKGYKGASAYTTDSFLRTLNIPASLKVGVMVNATELINYPQGIEVALETLFSSASESPVDLVRIACHVQEFEMALEASKWLKEKGYLVGYNLMQIADRKHEEIQYLAEIANNYPIDVLYFADSMGSLNPEEVASIARIFKSKWHGPLGIHTHDNMGFALANSLRAIEEGVLWIDGTVTGMGRGPGNVKTEYLVIEINSLRKKSFNILPLMNVIDGYFRELQHEFRWGTNTYYYLAGKHKIHPSYIQEMMNDSRYNEEDLLAVIDYLKLEGGKKFNSDTLETARNFYSKEPKGSWTPKEKISGKEVLILGTGPSIIRHKKALEEYIRDRKPFVIALNTQSVISPDLINIRAACHPVRLLADSATHLDLPQPLVIPVSVLSDTIVQAFEGKELLDFGITVQENMFDFKDDYCVLPNSLVLSYSLAIAASGKAERILLAGFDGYGANDLRTNEINQLLKQFDQIETTPSITAITPTQYKISSSSIYAI